MSKFTVGSSKFSRFMNGRGFYIALALCLVAIGSAAYIAVNNSVGFLSHGTVNSTPTASEAGSAPAGDYTWDASSTAQANNVVSNIPDSRAASSDNNAASASSAQTSSRLVNDQGEKLIFMMPCAGEVISAFSDNVPVYNKTYDDWRVQNGVDISVKLGTPIVAAADGTVSDVRQDPVYGEEVVIDHGNGLKSVYGNLTVNVTVKKAQKVSAGDVIGCVGSTARGEVGLEPHLYFAMTRNNSYINPISMMKN